jgi:hypothetical protein
MTLKNDLGILFLFLIFITAIFFVVFGQVTVRKLRKNPETRDYLGLEFVSGWDITNVAQTLFMPKWMNDKLKESPLSFLHANYDLLYKHTTKFDRILARVFYSLMLFTTLDFIVLVLLDQFGFFE